MTDLQSPARQFVAGFNLEPLRSLFNELNPSLRGGFAQLADGLRQFLMLPTGTGRALAVPNHHVLAAWRAFVTDSERYVAFCDGAYGQYLHIRLRSSERPLSEEALRDFYVEYLQRFGTVQRFWLHGIAVRHHEPLRVGEIPADLVGTTWAGWPGWDN